MMAWLAAFVLTQLVEVPITMRAQRGSALRRFAVSFGASALTHPIVWFVIPGLLLGHSYVAMVIFAETFAVITEAIWLSRFGVRRAFLWSFVANAASLGVGLALRATTGWV